MKEVELWEYGCAKLEFEDKRRIWVTRMAYQKIKDTFVSLQNFADSVHPMMESLNLKFVRVYMRSGRLEMIIPSE